MDIRLKIVKTLPTKDYVSKSGNKGYILGFVGETIDKQYNEQIAFKAFANENNINDFSVKVGRVYDISFDIQSREWNDKWYTDVKAWKVLEVTEQQVAAPQPTQQTTQPTIAQQQATPNVQATQQDDDLPF